jgi:flagellar M-ring protein FliF
VTEMKSLWSDASGVAKATLVIGVAAIVAITAWLAYWSLEQDYQVLFSDLAAQDAASMVSELDKLKINYKLIDNGKTILVPKESVYKTRLKLVSKNLPLNGTVGFEIFNNTDFGITEFAQKVNYQRALQGELTRTILAFDEIQAARVHLAQPESGLFKKAQSRAKASISLTMKPGKTMSRDQVRGIQRLVAASVAEIDAADVTVLDQKGIALSDNPGDGVQESVGWRLEIKKQTEDYFSHKIAQVMDKAFGPGQGIVSVDVLLNLDNVKVTTEDVVPAKGKGNESSAAGVIVRERQSLRDTRDGSAPAEVFKQQRLSSNGMTHLEVDYQSGRRVEQIVTTPGSVRRLSVGIVVPKMLDQARLDKIREVITMAVGLSKERGDAIAVYSLEQLSGVSPPVLQAAVPSNAEAPAPMTAEASGAPAQISRSEGIGKTLPQVVPYILGLIFLGLLFFLLRKPATRAPEPRSLNDSERQVLLGNIQQWLNGQAPAPAEAQRP